MTPRRNNSRRFSSHRRGWCGYPCVLDREIVHRRGERFQQRGKWLTLQIAICEDKRGRPAWFWSGFKPACRLAGCGHAPAQEWTRRHALEHAH